MSEPIKRITFVCEKCGSKEVRLDAWAEWDEQAQEWVLSTTYDYTHCLTCDAETRLREVAIDDRG
jgi:hypothetical protein